MKSLRARYRSFMIYTCKKEHTRLTVGNEYKEMMTIPNPYNAMVVNDLGDVEIFQREDYFKNEKTS